MSTISRSRLASASLPQLTAQQIADALGGRRTPRGWRCFCPSHHRTKKRHLDVSESAEGKPLVICRAGCTQSQVIRGLADRGLWSTPSASRSSRSASSSRPRFSWLDHVSSRPEPEVPPCCLRGRCEHWNAFEIQARVATMVGNLTEAIAELRRKYQRASRALDAGTLRGEIEFSIGFGAIVPTGMPEDVVAEVLDHVMIGNDAPPQDFIPLVVEMAEVLDEVDG